MQKQAGYILESLPELFAGHQKTYVEKLAGALSYFEMRTHNDLSVKNKDPFTILVHNIILRGIPTIAPTFIEDIISATFLKTKKEYSDHGDFAYTFVNDELKEEIFRALHLVDPRIKFQDLKDLYTFEGDPEAGIKKQFLFDTVATNIGEYFLQLFSPERDFDSIFKTYGLKYLEKARRLGLTGQKTDFSIQIPYGENNQPVGMAIELEKKLLDDREILSVEQKNDLLNEINWADLLYLKQSDIANPQNIQPLIEFSYQKYFEVIRKNYERPLFSTLAGLDGLQIALTPFEVARIQRVIVDYILAGLLDPNAAKWEIAVIERDVPGAFLAIQDLQQQFKNLYALAGVKKKLPEIELYLYYTEDFERAELNVLYQGNKYLVDEFDAGKKFDLVIDSSILRYEGLDKDVLETASGNLAVLRSSRYPASTRKFLTSDPIKYKEFYPVEKKDKKELKKLRKLQDNLMYFVKNIFRFYELKDEQIHVLSNILSGQSSIANMPYTYDKTLLFQIAAILQPGLTLVISPLYTVQRDQIRKFKRYRIDTLSFVNATVTDVYSYLEQTKKLTEGASLLLFSPAEAFHMDKFRKILHQLEIKDLAFALVVIDEIQAISPWSYLFNYGYVTLKQNIDTLLPKNKEITVLGLTSSASYDVLEDIKNILGISGKNIISAAHDFDNLDVNILPVTEKITVSDKQLDHKQIEETKLDYITQNLKPQDKTLIYTLKVKPFYNELKQKIYDKNIAWFDTKPQVRVFFASRRLAYESYANFEKFINNDIDILVGGRTVAVGLDKKDIRREIVASLPPGAEEMIQLLNRAGRDRNKSKIDIILNQTVVHYERLNYAILGNKLSAVKETKESYYDEYENSRLLQFLHGNTIKDIYLADELINNVTTSNDTLEEILVRRIRQDYDLWVRFELQPMIDPSMIYIYDDEELLGFLDLDNNTIENQASVSKRDLAEQILHFVDFEIREIVAKPRDIFLIFREPINSVQQISIIKKLAELKEGQKTTITIDFYNDVPKQIAKLFPDYNLDANQIVQLYNQTFSFNEFYSSLEKVIKRKELKAKREDLKKLYYRIRDFFDTYKLVYYFITIGLVEDYQVDLRNQSFVLVIKKLSDEQYLNNVYKRILPFVTKDKAIEVFEKIPRFEGNNLLQKVVNYWIYFEHSIIQNKFYISLSDLSKVVYEALKDENPGEYLKKYLQYYFRAKYLLEIKQKLKDYDQDWMQVIDFFVKKIGYFKDSWYHLLHSADIILNDQPSNFAVRMLKGWATLILSEDNNQLSKALDDIAKGMNSWREQYNITIEQFYEKIEDFYKTLENTNFDLKTKVEEIFTIKIMTTWLEEFNKKFIDITLNP